MTATTMDADNIKAGGRGRRVAAALKSIGISLLFLCIMLRNVQITSINSSSDQISLKEIMEEAEAHYAKPVEKIVLLGERHSGTNWITDHLRECFQGDDLKVDNHYSSWKHWFQEDDVQRVPENSAVVIAMFRDPYAWVEAMRVQPHHAHHHINLTQYTNKNPKGASWRRQGGKALGWKEFVTKPWVGKTITRYDIHGLGENFYEMQPDGSGRAYSSIIDLRRDKIINHLSVANFVGTRAYLPMRYEDLNANGTSVLLRSIEEAAGLKANCSAVVGKASYYGKGRRHLKKKKITKHSQLPDDFIDWMNEYVDWEVESRISYYRRNA